MYPLPHFVLLKNCGKQIMQIIIVAYGYKLELM